MAPAGPTPATLPAIGAPMKRALCCAALLLGAVFGCETAPEETCRTRPDGSGVAVDCEPAPGADWRDDALDEAEEGMERRGPGGRP